MSALAANSTDMVLGNVIGSNILNILLILGMAAVIHPISIKDNTVKKELPLTMLISTLLVVLFLDTRLGNGNINQISRGDGLVILLFFSVFMYYLLSIAKKKQQPQEDEKPPMSLLKSIFFIIIGLFGIILGSNFVVDNATNIASMLGISQRVISLTVIAFGTSLPELVTTIVSSKKGEQDLLVGNIIGSNIFNICVVLGIPVTIFGSVTPASFQPLDLIALVISAILLFIFSSSSRKITKKEGIFMLLLFTIYYTIVAIA